MQANDYPNTPGLWRLAAAASHAGLSPRMFADACERGDIPVTVVRIGTFRFVRCAELGAWLASRRTPSAAAEINLFN